jgi:hypothetical protein
MYESGDQRKDWDEDVYLRVSNISQHLNPG